ncbi:YqeG family HAD IIIA-type phosphatase [Fournierella sp.]|uniref:YqeG family HAD IIIA-type phosphatase n=1 Tax=Allofournierella sp. TaxID=1940256 RepID=UPI0025BBA3CA|nr:YqeG family HAD IIIA-type phosphatase [Fournierella sp.]
MFITPEYLFSGAAAITPEFLKEKGITALVLDVDNTLTGHDSQQLPEAIRDWLDRMRAAGIQLAIASNNNEERVRPFAQSIGLDYVAMSCKPLTFGLARARKKFGVPQRQMAIVGDQLFTDRLAGTLYGIPALVVQPMYEDFKKGIRFKRRLEKPFLARYFKKGGKLL